MQRKHTYGQCDARNVTSLWFLPVFDLPVIECRR